ncbi:MAG: PilZ domain-containing protein [Acidimicrobiales bacterium]
MTSFLMRNRDERRRYPRIRTTRPAAIGHMDGHDLVGATTWDLSLGGICLRGPIAAIPGDEILVVVALKERIVPAFGTVVRSEFLGEDDVVLHMEFSWFSEFGRERLAHLTRAVRSPAAGRVHAQPQCSD